MQRTWTGRVSPGSEAEHERFVSWLGSPEGQGLLARSLLTDYRLSEGDGRLTITFAAPEPPPIIRFLRNRRFWPEFWTFESADPTEAIGPTATERITWSRVGSAHHLTPQ